MAEGTSPIPGSCLCGGVRFELRGPAVVMGYCHCGRCRKAGGGAFLANVVYRRRDFAWRQGEDLVRTFQAEPPHDLRRSFCSRCGSYLGEPYCEGEHVVLAASTLDADPGIRPSFHEYVAHKAPWLEIHDDLPQFARDPDLGGGPES